MIGAAFGIGFTFGPLIGFAALEFFPSHVGSLGFVASALSLVARGEAALGIVYKSDAVAERGVRIVDTFPETTHAPIVYPGALVAPQKRPAARALLEFLRSAAARPIWETYGFTAL